MNGVLLLLKCKESYIRLSALRFFRTCVGMKDEFYNRHLLKLDIFGPIIQAFNETKSKYNLFNSACLEFFEFIRKENIKTLINYIGEKYSKSFDDVDYIDTFSSIILKYEQSKDPCGGLDEKENSESQKLEKDGWSKVDKSEEDYFNTSDEEENESTTPQTSSVIKDSSLSVATSPHLSNSLTLGVGGLVENYPDDEEEEEFPLRKKVLVVKSNSPTTNIFSNLNKNKFKSSININNNTSISKTVKSSSVIDIGNNVKVKNIYGSDDNNLQADSETFLNDDNDNSNLTSSNKTANCNLKRQRI
ncbi:Platinum sensitivity protein [Lobulomyces angularis]|nr:Platinum sensitivity protein [Lobulomyces angularis]